MVFLKGLGEGTLAGRYTLEQWLGGDNGSAFFAASLDDGERALVKVVPMAAVDAREQLAAWQRTRHLRHPHLVTLCDFGDMETAGEDYLYAAFEYPDDNLASAIEHGPISEAEARDVLNAALEALRYLHGQGLVHGAIGPQNIVAVGNTIKLATDSLRESDDLEGHAEDVRQLGELTRTLLAPNEIGEPLRTVVLKATEPDLRNRWTLAEIANLMRTSPVPPEPAPQPIITPEPIKPEPQPEPVVAAVAPAIPPVERRTPVERAAPIGFPRWIFAGLAVVLLLILALNLRRKPDTPVRSAPATAEPASQPQPLPPAPRPAEPKEAARDAQLPAVPPQPARASGRAMWRVIAFTYTSHDAAAKRAKRVNERWPDLHASVFSPKERRGYYLVALGGRMTHEDAVKIQRKARSAGLPRDTYVQNYSD
jgi:eukaryotic-like serine/threonine-protein kinase